MAVYGSYDEFNAVPEGTLIMPSMGPYKFQPGVVINRDYRRAHAYLDRDLWILILFGEKLHWQRADECQILGEV